jgi:hypothetical protein
MEGNGKGDELEASEFATCLEILEKIRSLFDVASWQP